MANGISGTPNLKFLHGNQSSLPTTGAVNGAFYLTDDTHRLYIGNQNGSCDLLSQAVITVADTTALNALTNVAEGQFYYVIANNILCVYHNSSWVQINPDTYLASNTDTMSVESITNGAKISNEVSDSAANPHVASGNFSIKEGNNIHVAVSGNDITISADNDNTNTTYTLGHGDVGTNNGSITLTPNSGTAQTLSITGANAARVNNTSTGIQVDVKQPVTAVGFSEAGLLSVTTELSGSAVAGGSSTPVIKLGTNADEYKFISGTATLPVYTKTETDSKISSALAEADAMTYKGVVSSSDASSKIVATANVGDTYKAFGAIAMTSIMSTAAKTGDLLIANGTDGAVTWDVVPSGDEQTITAEVDITSASTNASGGKAVYNVNDGSSDLEAFGLNGGSHISITQSGDEAVIAQTSDYTAQVVEGSTAAVTQESKNSETFTAVTAIKTDAYGNVVDGSIKTQTLTVVDTHNSIEEVGAGAEIANNVATITVSVKDKDADAAKEDSFTIGSSNLDITAATDGLNINLNWGTF